MTVTALTVPAPPTRPLGSGHLVGPRKEPNMAQDQTDLHTRTVAAPDGNAVITRRVRASTDAVWSVLADGWMYATWVVGASRIRAVEPQWPRQGARIHHSFGV